MKPTLYYAPTTCALATLIALEEAGADVEHVRLDLARGDTRHPAYLKLTPKGRVPVFVTERGVLSESPAILAWIAQTWPEAGLVPADDAWGTAQVNSFNNFLSGLKGGHAAGTARKSYEKTRNVKVVSSDNFLNLIGTDTIDVPLLDTDDVD